MTKKMTIRWQLRQLMANRGMFQTSDLAPMLAERGIHLSREQVYRLVTKTPQRLNMEALAALCDMFDCAPGDLIEVITDRHRSPRPAPVKQRAPGSVTCGPCALGDAAPTSRDRTRNLRELFL